MRRFIMGIQHRMLRRLPVGVRLYSLDLTFCALGIPSGFFTLFGNESRALRVLPEWSVKLWAVCLILGCIGWALGTLSAKKIGNEVVLIRVEIMIAGLTLVSGTSFVYALAMLFANGALAIQAAVPLLAFAIGTYIRRIDLIGRMESKDGP